MFAAPTGNFAHPPNPAGQSIPRPLGLRVALLISICLTWHATAVGSENREWNGDWARPDALLEELDRLQTEPSCSPWIQAAQIHLNRLAEAEGLEDPQCERIFDELNRQLARLETRILDLERQNDTDPQLLTRLRRLQYSLQRRLDIWQAVHAVARQATPGSSSTRPGTVQSASRPRLILDDVDPDWSEYLEMPAAAQMLNSLNSRPVDRRLAARKTLARFYSPALSTEQQQFLVEHIDPKTLETLKREATRPLDLARFVELLEKIETRSTGSNLYYLNDAYQSLLWSDDPARQALASWLHTHYRNANCRVVVSERLLNAILPPLPETQEPFRDQILGAEVVGQNRIYNQLQVKLIPDPDQIHLGLETVGQVYSRTQAQRSGFTIHNEGTSRFRVMQRLAVGRQGIIQSRPQSTSSTRQRVIGMRSNLDGIPLVGWMAHRIARQKIAEQTPLTNRITRYKLESSAEARFASEVEESLEQTKQYLQTNLIQPLVAMDLEPEPLETRTTEDNVVLRYRLAGRDQMAATTARPRGLHGSLINFQIHETAINNLLMRTGLAGNRFNQRELIEHLEELLQTEIQLPTDELPPTDVEFEFAPFDPLRVDFDEDRLTITLNLKSLQIGNGKTWHRLTVRAFFEPEIRGTQIIWKQDPDGISLQGYRLKVGDQMAIRTVFTKLFRDEYELPGLPAGVIERMNGLQPEIGQFVLTNDWLGVSIIERDAARLPTPSTVGRRRARSLREFRTARQTHEAETVQDQETP